MVSPTFVFKEKNMKKLLLALGFVTACAPAHADMIQINVPCDPAPEVMRIMLQYKNALLLQGTGTIASKDGKKDGNKGKTNKDRKDDDDYKKANAKAMASNDDEKSN